MFIQMRRKRMLLFFKMKNKHTVQILGMLMLAWIPWAMQAQTYDAEPIARITLENGIAIDTTLTAGEKFSGRAPMEVSFDAGLIRTADRMHYLWEIDTDPGYSNPDVSYEDKFDRRFDRQGTYYIRLTLTDLAIDSLTQYDEFVFTLAESKLQVPNVFTPNGDGVNDVLKVSYESLVSFRAAIFNRWGKKIHSWDDPDQGWDGGDSKPGVYFIVVEAKGADGQEYMIRKAVHLLRSLSNSYE